MANKVGDTLGDVNAKASVNRLTNVLAEVKSGTLGDKLGDVEAHAIVDALTDTLPYTETETLGEILSEAEELEKNVAYTLA